MSEKTTPKLDLAQDYQMFQGGGKPDYFIQGDNVFNYRKEFWYSLEDGLPPDKQETPEYKVEFLDVPVPYDPDEIKCPVCDHVESTRWGVNRHCRKVHHKNMKELEKKNALLGGNYTGNK